MLCASNRGGSLQGFRLDLKSGEMKQMTQAEGLDPLDPDTVTGQPVVLLPRGTRRCTHRLVSSLKERQL